MLNIFNKFLRDPIIQNTSWKFWVGILIILIPILFFPTTSCNYVYTGLNACSIQPNTIFIRIFFALILFSVLLVLRRLPLSFLLEYLIIFTTAFGIGILLIFMNEVNISGVDLLMHNSIAVFAIIFIICSAILMLAKKFFKSFDKKIWIYAPLIISELYLGMIFGSITAQIQGLYRSPGPLQTVPTQAPTDYYPPAM